MMTNKLWCLILVAVLAISCNNDDDELIGNWKRINDFDGPSRSGASCFVLKDTVYIGMGYNGKSTNNRLSDLWRYDVAKDSWAIRAKLPESVDGRKVYGRSHAAAFATDEKGYICAGLAEENKETFYLKDLWEYDPFTNKWLERDSLPETNDNPYPERSEAIGIALNGKGYVGGGRNDEYKYMKDFYEYDPGTNKWTEKTSMGGYKRRGAISFIANDGNKNMIYVGLGESSGSYPTDLYAYDVDADEWKKKAELKNATDHSFDDDYANMQRVYGVAFNLDGVVYVTLGQSGSYHSDTWAYDATIDRWYQKTSFEGSVRVDAVAFSVYDRSEGRQRGFVETGSAGSNIYEDVWEFHPWVERDDHDNG